MSNLSTVRFSVGDSETALQDETRAADIYRELVAHDEENVDWLLRALNHESQVLWLDITVNPGSGKQRGMNTILRRAEAVASTDPDNGDWAKHVSDIALNTLFAALFESDEELVDELLPRYANRSSLPVDIRVADSDAVEDYLRSMLALSIRSRQLHNIDDAISHANAALAQIDPHPEIVARNLETAVILHRVAGNASTANQLEEQMMVQGFRSPGYVRTLGLLN